MNFDFSDDQKMLKSQARKFLSEKCSTKTVRTIFESTREYDAPLWKQIGDLGWAGTAIPEIYGGLGLGYLELCVIAEEMGRALAPVPFSSTVYLFAEALMLCGSEDLKKSLLSQVASGAIIGTLAYAETQGAVLPKKINTTFQDGKLSGTKIAVVDGAIADYAIVLARASLEPDEKSLQLVLVNLHSESVKREPCNAIDGSRSHANLIFDHVNAQPLANVGEGWMNLSRTLDRAAVLFAFEQIGGSDACLSMAIDYALKRYAFGRPIGSFQAIKHKLTDMYVNNELARSNAYYAAWALSTHAPELPLAAAAARVSSTQAYDYASKENIQTHGGIGFTWESDCHFYYKRSKELGLLIGSQRAWKDKLVTELEKTEHL